MTKKLLAVFAQVLAALYGIYGLYPIVVATQIDDDAFWFRVVVGLGGLSAIVCGVVGFWFAAKWRRRSTSPTGGRAAEPSAKAGDG